MGDRKVLTELAAALGLERVKVETLLTGREGEEEVRQAEEKAYGLGIEGVPFFIFNEKFAVSGAQEVKTFVKAIERASQS